MEFTAVIQSCDFEEDTLTLQLPKGFWSTGLHEIQAGDVVIKTDSIGPRGTLVTEKEK